MTFNSKDPRFGAAAVSKPQQSWTRLPIGLGLVLILSGLLAGCGDPAEIKTLKNGKLDLCPGITLGTMVKGYMQRVRWESAPLEDGSKQVNIIGLVSVEQVPVTARLEFVVDEEANSYRYSALNFDDEAQDGKAAAGLLSAMCTAAGGGPEAGQDSGDGQPAK